MENISTWNISPPRELITLCDLVSVNKAFEIGMWNWHDYLAQKHTWISTMFYMHMHIFVFFLRSKMFQNKKGYQNKSNIALMSKHWIVAMHWFDMLQNDGTKIPAKYRNWPIKQMSNIPVDVIILN